MFVNIGNYPDSADWGTTRNVEVRIDAHDLFSLDATLAQVIYPALVKFKEVEHGHPSSMSREEWYDILDTMIEAFRIIVSDEFYDILGEDDPKSEKMRIGLANFGKHYLSLWT